MGVTATVPVLPGAAVSQERSYASYSQSRRRSSSGTVVATRLSTSGFSTRELFMHHVDQLLKQHEVAWNRSYACPDEDAIEPLLLELALNNCLRSFTKVG